MPPRLLHLVAVLFHIGDELGHVLGGKSLRAVTTAGECAVKPIGSKSLEDRISDWASTGAATCDPMLPASKV